MELQESTCIVQTYDEWYEVKFGRMHSWQARALQKSSFYQAQLKTDTPEILWISTFVSCVGVAGFFPQTG